MLSLFERLTKRQAEKHREQAGTWAAFVEDVEDKRLTNDDEILAALDRLNRSPKELTQDQEKLIERRELNSKAVAGDAAEIEYAKLQQQSADAEKSLADMIEKHHAKHEPLDRKIEAARNAISTAADARRRLLETAGNEAKRAAFGDIDAELAEVQAERQALQRTMKDRRDWIFKVETMGLSAAAGDSERLPSQREGLKKMQQMDSEIGVRITALQNKRNAAAESLLRPECI